MRAFESYSRLLHSWSDYYVSCLQYNSDHRVIEQIATGVHSEGTFLLRRLQFKVLFIDRNRDDPSAESTFLGSKAAGNVIGPNLSKAF